MFDNLIIAHRGIHNNIDIPENSIDSFNKAIENKLPIEIDIRKTKDDILVVVHDKTLKRLTGLSTSVENLKFNEIKKLKLLGTKEHIPTLEEVLKLVNGKVLIDIEIKNCKSWKKVCKILINDLSKYKYPYIIKSFNPKIIKYIKKLNENITVGLLIKNQIYNKIIGNLILKYYNPDFLAISKKIINKNKIKNHLLKYNIIIWTISSKKEMNKYKHITNNYICNISI